MRVPHLPRFRRRGVPCHLWNMQTVYKATGGADGLLRLASAWHARVMADEVVSHAFSHGFHPEHTQRFAAYWAEALGGPTTYSDSMATRPQWCGCIAARARTRRWTVGRLPASIRHWQ